MGGYGLFGSRIASGLIIQSIAKGLPTPTVFINSRHKNEDHHSSILSTIHKKMIQLKSQESTEHHNISELITHSQFDAKNSSVLESNLRNLKVDLVINCIGPFQSANYSIPILCAKLRLDYLDLADARDYVSSFSRELDSIAKTNNVRLITGTSTFPGVSSAACEYLINLYNFSKIEKIEIGMSPGNKAPRGLATMESILTQVGQPIKWADNDKTTYGWQELKLSNIGEFHPKMRNSRRWLSALDIPDMQFLPKFVADLTHSEKLPRVEFRAGLEIPTMHLGLWSASWLVRYGLIGNLAKYSKVFKRLSELKPFLEWGGSDTGGMFVKVHGWSERKQKEVTVIWRLFAGGGEGIQIPATPSVALYQKIVEERLGINTESKLPVGAYPCLGLFSREEFMDQLRLYNIDDDVIEI